MIRVAFHRSRIISKVVNVSGLSERFLRVFRFYVCGG